MSALSLALGDRLAVILIELLHLSPLERRLLSHGFALLGRHFLLHGGDFLVVKEFDDARMLHPVSGDHVRLCLVEGRQSFV